jgi:hypothetical protein
MCHFYLYRDDVKVQLDWSAVGGIGRPDTVRGDGTVIAQDKERGAMAAGEAPIKRAVKWIDDQLVERPEADRVTLVDEASRRFDLTPIDADFLFRHLAERAKKP